MNAPIDTLAFAKNFEEAGFGHEQARALASAFGQTRESAREDMITRDVLRSELAELKLDLIREINLVGKELNGRLWSTIAIIAGVSTAISATVGAGVALLLKSGGL